MSGVGRRYAGALMACLKGADAEAVLGDLTAFQDWLRDVKGLRSALENPGVPSGVKEALVREVARKAGFQEASARFVLLVVEKRRVRQWGEMVKAFREALDETRGILRGQMVTARPLNVKEAEAFASRLEKVFGRPVRLDARVAPEILGGVQVQVGSTVYDGSVAGALKALREDLAKG
jgi:F-type H+-transporting ATPase subunit delta